MLTITPQASEAIRGILSSENVPDGAVLRISPELEAAPGAEPGLALSVTDSPPDEDQTIEVEDVEVSVEPSAAQLLDDKQLDATVVEGQVNFSIADQSGAA